MKLLVESFDIKQRTIPQPNVSVFLSSTFDDTKIERELILQRILPALQRKGRVHGIEVKVSDMRFGVKDENVLDHMAWEVCRAEINRCFSEQGAKLCFLSLQGDRYGYRGIPKYIDKDTLEAFVAKKMKDVALDRQQILSQFISDWYQLDDNHIPARYVLRHILPECISSSTMSRYDTVMLSKYYEVDGDRLLLRSEFASLGQRFFYTNVLPALRDELLDELCFDGDNNLLIGHSVTEWETLYAMTRDASRCFWMHRALDLTCLSESTIEEKVKLYLCDFYKVSDDTIATVRHRHNLLIELMSEKLNPSQIRHFDQPPIDPVRYLSLSNGTLDDYLEAWERALFEQLSAQVDEVVDMRRSWERDGCGLEIKGALVDEMLHHCRVCDEKVATFFGRKSLVSQGLDTLKEIRPELEKNAYPGISFYLVGASGSGKTSLLSQIAIECYRDTSGTGEFGTAQIPVVVRYCGTSSLSLDGIDLMHSISLQILLLYQQHCRIAALSKEILEELRQYNQFYEENHQDFNKMKEIFSHVLLKYPVYLFIDSLDQLSNNHDCRSRISFLRNVKVHNSSHIVVSCLPDGLLHRADAAPEYFYLCHTRLKESGIPFLDTTEYSYEDLEDIVSSLLAQKHRRLTCSQKEYLFHDIFQRSKDEATHTCSIQRNLTMLYLRLVLTVVENQWTSFFDPRESQSHSLLTHMKISPDLSEMISILIQNWKNTFGAQLTTYALAFITISLRGISDNEMRDLLTLCPTVLNEVCQYFETTALPMHVWLRLRQQLQPFLSERKHGCWKWYHRQLQEVLLNWLSVDKSVTIISDAHKVMAEYFTNPTGNRELDSMFDAKVASQCSQISIQPLLWAGSSMWQVDRVLNERRAVEGFFHCTKVGCLLIDWRRAVTILCDFDHIFGAFECDEGVRFLECLLSLYTASTTSATISAIGSDISVVDRQEQLRLRDYLHWIRRSISAIQHNPSAQIVFTATSEPINSFVYQDMVRFLEYRYPNLSYPRLIGRTLGQIVESSNQQDIIDSKQRLLQELTGHVGEIGAICVSADDEWIVSSSKSHVEGNIKIWDSNTGICLATLERPEEFHKAFCTAVDISANKGRIIASFSDHRFFVWDCLRQSCIQTFEDSDAVVYLSDDSYNVVLRLSNQGEDAFMTTTDGKVKVWNISSGLCTAILPHPNIVTDVCLLANSRQIVTKMGSPEIDNALYLWTKETGQWQLTQKLSGDEYVLHKAPCTLKAGESSHESVLCAGLANDKTGIDGVVILQWVIDVSTPASAAAAVSTVPTVLPTVLWKFHTANFKIFRLVTNPLRVITAGAESGLVQVWEFATRQMLLHFHHPKGLSAFKYVCLSADGGRLIVPINFIGKHSIHVYDCVNIDGAKTVGGRLVTPLASQQLRKSSRMIGTMSISTKAGLMAIAFDNLIQIWNLASLDSSSFLREWAGSSQSLVNQLYLMNDGHRVFSSSGTTVSLWDTHSGTLITTVVLPHDMKKRFGSGYNTNNAHIKMVRQEELLVTLSSGIITIFSYQDDVCSQLQSFQLFKTTIPFHVDEDGHRLILATSSNIYVWNRVEQRQYLAPLTVERDYSIRECDINNATRRIVAVGNKHGLNEKENMLQVTLWHSDTGETVQTRYLNVPELGGEVTLMTFSVQFCLNGAYFLIHACNMATQLWDTMSGTCVKVLLGTESSFVYAVSSRKKYEAEEEKDVVDIVSADSDNLITMWSFSPKF